MKRLFAAIGMLLVGLLGLLFSTCGIIDIVFWQKFGIVVGLVCLLFAYGAFKLVVVLFRTATSTGESEDE